MAEIYTVNISRRGGRTFHDRREQILGSLQACRMLICLQDRLHVVKQWFYFGLMSEIVALYTIKVLSLNGTSRGENGFMGVGNAVSFSMSK
jgi:hypothetical protein